MNDYEKFFHDDEPKRKKDIYLSDEEDDDDDDEYECEEPKVYVDSADIPYSSHTYSKQPKYVTKKAIAWIVILCIFISAGCGFGTFYLADKYLNSPITKKLKTTHYDLAKATGSELSIQEIAAKNENSVVAITTESIATDSWLRQYVTQGAGSGIVFSKDGYIVTNNHVISGAKTITVTFHDGDTATALLVAGDAQTDVAVLKVEKSNLVPVTFGKMDDANIGDLAVAIGNPLGTLAGTVTEGIISGLEREITIDGKIMTLIQTSASINPGNSGGGLFDQYGNLIGLVVAKSAGSAIEGLGFAIPCDKVSKIAKSLISKGYVEDRPAAGITILDLTDANNAMRYGVSITGVYIQEVTGKNAKEAGLKPGDLIYYVGKKKVTGSSMLVNEIQKHKIGDVVTFTIVRDNEIMKIKVELEAANTATTSGLEKKDKEKDEK